jgi:hypothetical protein
MGCQYRLFKQEIHGWLTQFGEVISNVTEDKFETENENDSDEHMMENGTCSVKT